MIDYINCKTYIKSRGNHAMYTKSLPEILKTTTMVSIKYDCCQLEREMKWVDANKNFSKNDGKHICKSCGRSGDLNPARRLDVKAKIKATIDEKYGGVLPMNTEEAIQAKKDNLKNPEFREQRNQKRIATSIERYGAEHHMKTEEGKQTQKDAMIEKYGVEHPLQSPEIVAKMLKTVQERHGVDNVMQIPEVVEKQQEATLEAYGVKHYNQLPEAKEYLRENCTTWLAQSYANPWAKGIPKSADQKSKASRTVTEKMLKGECNYESASINYIIGYYISKKCRKREAYFRSSLELRMHYLLDTDETVIEYENEPFSISYSLKDGTKKNYIPDFIVRYYEGKVSLKEIKPAFRMREESVRHKVMVGENFCSENNMDFHYVDEKFLYERTPDMEFLISLENVKILSK